MDLTDEYFGAVDRHESSVQRLSDLLQQYRDNADLSRDSWPETELDAAAQRYEETSAELSGVIMEHLVLPASGAPDQGDDGIAEQDDDAVARMTASLEIDAVVAPYTTVLIALRDPEGDGHALRTGPLAGAELAALGDGSVTNACAAAFGVLKMRGDASAQPTDSGSAASPGTSDLKVKPYFDAILDRAATDIRGTILSGLAWEKMVVHALAHGLAELGQRLPELVRHALTPLRRLLAHVWRQALSKIAILVGPGTSQAGTFVLNIIQDFVPDAEAWSVGELLGRALKVAKPQESAQVLVDAYPDSAPKVQKACAGVVAHHAKRRRLVRGLNLALPGLQLLHGPGVPLQVLATAVLLVYQVWLVHDHLDSPVMEEIRLPKNSGLLREVRAAVA